MKGLLLFLCNSFGRFFFFFLLALAAQPELQAGLETTILPYTAGAPYRRGSQR